MSETGQRNLFLFCVALIWVGGCVFLLYKNWIGILMLVSGFIIFLTCADRGPDSLEV